MEVKAIHYLAHSKIEEMFNQNEIELKEARRQKNEAASFGDLSENSEYDSASSLVSSLSRKRDTLLPALSLPIIKASDSTEIFEEGCVLNLKIFKLMSQPVNPESEDFKQIVENTPPVFEGILMLGGTIDLMDLLVDGALSTSTAIGAFLLRKTSGYYSVAVPGGFACIYAKKLRTTEFKPEELRGVYNGA